MSDISIYPLLPLTEIVLPNGKLSLRVFEPRYLQLVKESVKNQKPFVIGSLKTDKNLSELDNVYEYGVLSKIVDFTSVESGILGITVQGIQRCQVLNMTLTSDKLRMAEVTLLDNWGTAAVIPEYEFLAARLQDLYREYNELGDLYAQPEFSNLSWVCERWLEIVPLEPEEKNQLLGAGTIELTLKTIKNLIKDDPNC